MESGGGSDLSPVTPFFDLVLLSLANALGATPRPRMRKLRALFGLFGLFGCFSKQPRRPGIISSLLHPICSLADHSSAPGVILGDWERISPILSTCLEGTIQSPNSSYGGTAAIKYYLLLATLPTHACQPSLPAMLAMLLPIGLTLSLPAPSLYILPSSATGLPPHTHTTED